MTPIVIFIVIFTTLLSVIIIYNSNHSTKLNHIYGSLKFDEHYKPVLLAMKPNLLNYLTRFGYPKGILVDSAITKIMDNCIARYGYKNCKKFFVDDVDKLSPQDKVWLNRTVAETIKTTTPDL